MKRRFLKPIVMLLIMAVVGVVVMALWNFIIPPVIGWGTLSYLQAVGLSLLCRLLFGSYSGVRERTRVTFASDRDELKSRLKGMSREQRQEYIRNYMRNEQ